jgi:hypothetical protein
VDPIRPVPLATDRTVPAVDLTRLTPLEREREKQRRERERRRRQPAVDTPETPSEQGGSGIDVRV